MTTLERYYGTQNRSGFSCALEIATIGAHNSEAEWIVIRHLGEDDYHSVLPAADSVPVGYVVSCTVTAKGEVIGS